jgi:hypothetical protein
MRIGPAGVADAENLYGLRERILAARFFIDATTVRNIIGTAITLFEYYPI